MASLRLVPPAHQPTLDLQFTLANGLDVQPELPARLFVIDDQFSRQPTPRSELPPAGAWVARISLAMVEVYLGQRPASQLVRWTTPEILSRLQYSARVRAAHPSGHNPRSIARIGRYTIASMRVIEPADGIVEATVILIGPHRPIALALRLEGLDGRWICTVVDTPDHSITGYSPDDYLNSA